MARVAERRDEHAQPPVARIIAARSVSRRRRRAPGHTQSRTILAMRRSSRRPARRLRLAVERLPRRTREAMLRGIETNRIIVGAYVDPRSGGVCPMLAAHRNGGRTSVATFARAWDEYTGARRPRRATRREVHTLRSLLEASLAADDPFETTPISELAAQIRTEREALAACHHAPLDVPAFDETGERRIRVRRNPSRDARDLLAATEDELG
jgi:hypothetical protein